MICRSLKIIIGQAAEPRPGFGGVALLYISSNGNFYLLPEDVLGLMVNKSLCR